MSPHNTLSCCRRVATRASAVLEKTKTYSGVGVDPPAKGHHFLHIDDFSKEELWAMLQTSIKVLYLTCPCLLPTLPIFLALNIYQGRRCSHGERADCATDPHGLCRSVPQHSAVTRCLNADTTLSHGLEHAG